MEIPCIEMRSTPDFLACIPQEDIDLFERESSAVYGLSAGLQLTYLNPGWFRFADANDGQTVIERFPLGASVARVVPEPLVAFYRKGLEQAQLQRGPWEHRYECSSPDVRRVFRMRVMALRRGGFLVINGLEISEGHPAGDAPFERQDYTDYKDYKDRNGFIVMCSHCRRTRRLPAAPSTAERWDFVPSLLERPNPDISHGLCGPCLAYHYRGADD